MIVDDHADIRRVLKKIINVGLSESIEFIECNNGETAIAEYENHHPDYVIMDVELKAMNGLVATKLIKKNDANAKILIVTSHDSPTFRQKAKELKVQGFVSKDDLSVIHQYLNVT